MKTFELLKQIEFAGLTAGTHWGTLETKEFIDQQDFAETWFRGHVIKGEIKENTAYVYIYANSYNETQIDDKIKIDATVRDEYKKNIFLYKTK